MNIDSIRAERQFCNLKLQSHIARFETVLSGSKYGKYSEFAVSQAKKQLDRMQAVCDEIEIRYTTALR